MLAGFDGRSDSLARKGGEYSPRDICSVKDCKTRIVLPVSHFQTRFQAVCFGIPDICPVQKGAKEQEGQNGEDSKQVTRLVNMLGTGLGSGGIDEMEDIPDVEL